MFTSRHTSHPFSDYRFGSMAVANRKLLMPIYNIQSMIRSPINISWTQAAPNSDLSGKRSR